MILSDLDSVIREHMDLTDRDTLKKMTMVTEANQNLFLVALTSRLYDKIQEKATRIDFSTIEQSRGDITKIQNYKSMCECVDIIRRIVREYKESTIPVDTVVDAIKNVKDRSKMFGKAFVIGSSLPMLTYNTVCLSIVESISFLISVCIEYIKSPGNDTFQMALDVTAYNKSQQNLLFTNLAKFNAACKSHELDNAMSLVMSQAVANREAADARYDAMEKAPVVKDHPFLTDEEIASGNTVVVHDDDEKVQHEGVKTLFAYAGNKVLLWIAKIFVPFIRQLVYYHYYHKQKISDYWADQANLLEMNAMAVLANQDIPEEERKRIYARQMKIVEKYRKRANEYSIDAVSSKKNAEKLEAEESRKFKAEDIEKDYSEDEDYNYSSIFEASIAQDYGVKDYGSPFATATLSDRIAHAEKVAPDLYTNISSIFA